MLKNLKKTVFFKDFMYKWHLAYIFMARLAVSKLNYNSQSSTELTQLEKFVIKLIWQSNTVQCETSCYN